MSRLEGDVKIMVNLASTSLASVYEYLEAFEERSCTNYYNCLLLIYARSGSSIGHSMLSLVVQI